MQTKPSAHDMLAQYLTENGMRKTPERYAVLDVLMQTDEHLSAEEIHSRMPKDFKVSRGTVYNTLMVLVRCGLAYQLCARGTYLYERAYGNKPHSHYMCIHCDKIWNFRDDSMAKAMEDIPTPKFRKMYFNIYIYGLCSACQAKHNKAIGNRQQGKRQQTKILYTKKQVQ